MINIDLVYFLLENHTELLGLPLLGHLRSVFSLYIMDRQSNGENKNNKTFNNFVADLKNIIAAAPESLSFRDDCSAYCENEMLTFIDRPILLHLLNVLGKSPESIVSHVEDTPKRMNVENRSSMKQPSEELLDRLMQALDGESSTCENALLRHKLLNELQKLLEIQPASIQLSRERVQNTMPISDYIPVCNNRRHGTLLASSVNVTGNRIISLQTAKLSKAEACCSGFTECLQEKIHYTPNLKPQTDLNLGDCSYLDTCHKLNSCRYVHYLQYIPQTLRNKVAADTKKLNEQILSQRRVPFYTHGDCSSDVVKPQLPQQWIQCDVRKFDFTILGKFSAVIADPAWNIHMNLPYGTCNDIELLDLPLDQLQDEGILFLWVTGRAIELGKESLEKWGYKVVHEISWIKTNQLGRTIVTGRTGHWLNHSKEHILVGLKGNPPWINRRLDTDLIVSSTRETSRKPDELYGLIERLVGTHARKLEIFGRDHNLRPGWFTVGNQITGSSIHEIDVKKKYDRFISRCSPCPKRTPQKNESTKSTSQSKLRAKQSHKINHWKR